MKPIDKPKKSRDRRKKTRGKGTKSSIKGPKMCNGSERIRIIADRLEIMEEGLEVEVLRGETVGIKEGGITTGQGIQAEITIPIIRVAMATIEITGIENQTVMITSVEIETLTGMNTGIKTAIKTIDTVKTLMTHPRQGVIITKGLKMTIEGVNSSKEQTGLKIKDKAKWNPKNQASKSHFIGKMIQAAAVQAMMILGTIPKRIITQKVGLITIKGNTKSLMTTQTLETSCHLITLKEVARASGVGITITNK